MKYLFSFSFLIFLLLINNSKSNKEILSSLFSTGFSHLNNINNILSFKNETENKTIEELEKEEADNLRGRLFTILRNLIESTNVTKNNKNISKACSNVINKYLFGHIDEKNSSNISYIISDYNIIKFLDDSSKNRNNLGTYTNCMEKTYKMKSLYKKVLNKYNTYKYDLDKSTLSTYVVLSIEKFETNETNETDEKNILELYNNFFLQGYCFPQGYNETYEYCSDEDYLKLIKYVNEKQINNVIGINNNSKIKVFSLRTNPYIEKEYFKDWEIFVQLLPFLFFSIIACANIFGYLIISIINCCKKNKNDDDFNMIDENEIKEFDLKNKSINKTEKEKENKNKRIKEFFKCFDFIENGKELFNFSLNSTKYNKDSGLIYIRGLMGLSMIFVLIGFTFIVLYNSPIKESSPKHIEEFFENDYFLNIIVTIGIRYSPRVIISCSGYLFIYKYISYLNKNYYNNNESIIKLCFKFISYQSHKYFLLIMLLLFERYSAYHLYNLFYVGENPAFKYLYLNILQKPEISRFFYALILYGKFYYHLDEQFRDGNNILHFFWMPFNEIIFFLVGILFITICFKQKWRFDIFILILIPILFIGKIVYFYLTKIYDYKDEEGNKVILPLNEKYSTLYYVFFNYGRDMIHPLFNLIYYLIGIYFGLINYSIQKGIRIIELPKINFDNLFTPKDEIVFEDDKINNSFSKETKLIPEEKKENNKEKEQDNYSEEVKKMPFLITPIKLVQWHRNRTKKCLIIIYIIFIILFFFFAYVLLIFGARFGIQKAFINFIVNLIYLIDIDFVVIFVQWFSFYYMIKTNDSAFKFFNNIIWITLSRPYFSFILIINTLLLFIFYHEETLNEVNNISILMFSLIGGGLTFPFMILFYIFYELPLKRVIRFFYKNDYDIKEEEVEYKIKEISDHSESDDNSSEKIIKNKIE